MKLLIKVKNINLMEEVETEEAEEILKEVKRRFLLWWLIPTCLFALCIPFFIASFCVQFDYFLLSTSIFVFCILSWFFTLSSLIALIICLNVYLKKMKPFYKLLKVAKLNDRVRHEEKIKEMERQRIKQGHRKELFEVKDIDNTIKNNKIYEELFLRNEKDR